MRAMPVKPTVQIAAGTVIADYSITKCDPTAAERDSAEAYCTRYDIPMNEFWDGSMYEHSVTFRGTENGELSNRTRRLMFKDLGNSVVMEAIKSELMDLGPCTGVYVTSLAELWVKLQTSEIKL